MSREMTPEQIEEHKQFVRTLVDSGIIINKEDSATLDKILEDCYAIIENGSYTNNEEKDKAYGDYRKLAMDYGRTLGQTLYNFGLDEDEYKLLKKVIMRDNEYDRQDIHIGLLVKDEYFDKMESRPNWSKEKFNQGVEILACDINTTTRISHLFGKYKIKGLGRDAEIFYEISKKIVDVSKIFEYYNNMGEQMSKDAMNWTQGLDDETPQPTDNEEKVLITKDIKPKQ